MRFQILFLLVGTALASLSCSKTSSVSTPLYDGVSLVASAVGATGSGLSTSRMINSQRVTTPLTSALCGDHGRPKLPASEGGTDMPESDDRYPTVHTYCAMTYSDGDTVIGGFDLAKSLICALENGGLTFTGSAQSIDIDFSNTTCWPSGGPEGRRTTLTITATGTSPASFNSHYEKGVDFTVDLLGLHFQMGANIDGDKIEFIAYEDWSGIAAGDSAGNQGVMAGEITKSTGVLRFEKRDERIRNTCTNSSCGWNRHTRILANLVMSGDEPTDLTSFSYGYSDTQDTTMTATPAPWASAKVITAKGALASEIKSRLFSVSNKTTAQVKSVAQWAAAEDTNTACASASGVIDSDCSTQTGIDLFSTDTKFLLYDATDSHLSPANWFSAFSGFNFTDVVLNADQAF